jgi:hypothetical protein
MSSSLRRTIQRKVLVHRSVPILLRRCHLIVAGIHPGEDPIAAFRLSIRRRRDRSRGAGQRENAAIRPPA